MSTQTVFTPDELIHLYELGDVEQAKEEIRAGRAEIQTGRFDIGWPEELADEHASQMLFQDMRYLDISRLGRHLIVEQIEGSDIEIRIFRCQSVGEATERFMAAQASLAGIGSGYRNLWQSVGLS